MAQKKGNIPFYVIGNLGMEKRPRRFSLGEALFEGTVLAAGGLFEHETITGRGAKWSQQAKIGESERAEFRTAEKNAETTA